VEQTFELVDGQGRRLKVTVKACGAFLNLLPEGYGNPVSLDWDIGTLRLLVNPEADAEEPHIIDLEGAKPRAVNEDDEGAEVVVLAST
jgi:hypothetical protein